MEDLFGELDWRIFDLDDGVSVNYEKFEEAVAKI